MFSRVSYIAAAILFATAVVARPGDYRPYETTTTEDTNVVNAPTENKCNNVGGQQCCNSVDYASPEDMQTLLNVISIPVNANTLVGHGCSPLVGLDATCNAQAVCCEDSYQGIGVSCNNIAL